MSSVFITKTFKVIVKCKMTSLTLGAFTTPIAATEGDASVLVALPSLTRDTDHPECWSLAYSLSETTPGSVTMASQLSGATVALNSVAAPTHFVVPALTLGAIAQGTYTFRFAVADQVSTSISAQLNFAVQVT